MAATSLGQIAPGVGWVVQSGHLYWTNDNGGSWADITPSDSDSRYRGNMFDRAARQIGGVFFLDSSHGWVLLVVGAKNGGTAGFDLASTSDGGASWSLSQLSLPSLGINEYGGSGEIFFLDSAHGWINLRVASSVQFPWGVLLVTVDGGATWTAVRDRRGSLGAEIGAMRFTNMNDGWIAGGPDGGHLYVTHDGGHTWADEGVPIPASISGLFGTIGAQYALPAFTDSEHGLLPATYSGLPRGQSLGNLEVVALFSTQDGGRSWNLQTSANIDGQTAVLATVDSELVGALSPAGQEPGPQSLIKLGPGGTVTKTVATEPSAPINASQIAFADAVHGWALAQQGATPTALFSTDDGGATWKDITPVKLKPTARPLPRSSGSPRAPIPLPAPPNRPGPWLLNRLNGPQSDGSSQIGQQNGTLASATIAAGSAPQNYKSRHVGFDTSCAPNSTFMTTWWSNSPYYDVGIYLGNVSDSNMSCPQQKYLSATWVSQTTSQGWGLLPLWVGPQAPCGCARGTWPNCNKSWNTQIATDGSAYSQGTGEASAAEAATQAYGLPVGSPIYADIENYDPLATVNGAPCSVYVNDFLSGWIDQLKADGYLAGAYGNAIPAASWYSGVSPLPDDIWVPVYNQKVKTWGLTTQSGLGPTDNAWNQEQRVHQYWSDSESYGGTTSIPTDDDIEDADAVGGNGAKSYLIGLDSRFQCGYDGGDWTGGLNNTGQAVGYYIDQNINSQGFIFDSKSGGCTTLPSFVGVTQITPEGINDQGQIVGTYRDSSNAYHGFLYDTNTQTFTGPLSCPNLGEIYPVSINDDGQIAAVYYPPGGTSGVVYPQCIGITYPTGSSGTWVQGINGQGIVTGFYSDGPSSHGFTYNPATGVFSAAGSLDYPGAYDTDPEGINDNGLITGTWDDLNGNFQSFFYDSAASYWLDLAFDNPAYASCATSLYGINDTAEMSGVSGCYQFQWDWTVPGMITVPATP